jgi:hypothetical protein
LAQSDRFDEQTEGGYIDLRAEELCLKLCLRSSPEKLELESGIVHTYLYFRKQKPEEAER